MKIEINEDWYIEDDDLCYRLHHTEEHPSKKDVNVMVRGDKVTYYATVRNALESIVEKERLSKSREFVGTLQDYINHIERIDDKIWDNISTCSVVRQEDDMR